MRAPLPLSLSIMGINIKTGWIVVGWLIVMALSGCRPEARPKQDSPDTDKDIVALQVALVPTLDCLPFLYAADKGYFRNRGINVKWNVQNSLLDCETALSRQTADVVVSDLVKAVKMQQSSKRRITVLMATEARWALLSSREVRVRKLSQLKDRTVAVARFTATDLLSDLYAQSGGMNPNAIYRPQINNINLRAQMLNEKQVEAAILPEPQATMSQTDGNRRLGTGEYDGYGLGCLVAYADRLQSAGRQNAVKELIAGYDWAVSQLNGRRDTYRDSVALHYGMVTNVDRLKRIKWPRYGKAASVKAADVNRAVQFLRQRGIKVDVLPITKGKWVK